jgi:Cysteine sulfinate desulfinase/cysteine desulfurase and related enzymes
MVYLDYAAHTPADGSVIEAFTGATKPIGNPLSSHSEGRKAAAALESYKESIAAAFGFSAKELILTSGATEANNSAIKGIFNSSRHLGKRILASPLEHPSVSAPLARLKEKGADVDFLKLEANGKIDLEDLKSKLTKDTILVTVVAVDGEIGIIQPIKETAAILKAYPDCRLHVDATQAAGKIPFDFSYADAASFSPHKFYGIAGIGALYRKRGIIFEPLVDGGGDPYRAGTPALGLAASFAKASELAAKYLEDRYARVSHLNLTLREGLEKISRAMINSPSDAVPHIINLGIEGHKGAEIQKALDERGICVSVKSACSVPNAPSAAVFALTGNKRRATESFRVSLSHSTTEDEIDNFLKALKEII